MGAIMTNTAVLDTPMRKVDGVFYTVDLDFAEFQFFFESADPVMIVCEDVGSKTVFSIVGQFKHLVVGFKTHEGRDGTESFFPEHAHFRCHIE